MGFQLSQDTCTELDLFINTLSKKGISIYDMSEREKQLIEIIEFDKDFILENSNSLMYQLSSMGEEFLRIGGYDEIRKGDLKQKRRTEMMENSQILKNWIGIASFIYLIVDVIFTLFFKQGLAISLYYLITGG